MNVFPRYMFAKIDKMVNDKECVGRIKCVVYIT